MSSKNEKLSIKIKIKGFSHQGCLVSFQIQAYNSDSLKFIIETYKRFWKSESAKNRERCNFILHKDISLYASTSNEEILIDNLKCGGHRIHQVLKWCPLDSMATSVWNDNSRPNVFQRQSSTPDVVLVPL
ncbi:uncharacterized protein EV154DRAFT_475498 [Mucor mucedo]|uniref:uncharacterized protein n=1 Tax=Mucor mucedo TaxID=29922 RepID=UPI00222087DD|nr:uncharacterized protein EV154DRAFT_475498 [Mucor mucedo]KAI7897173.1 hypothetical protein EV154DRAFT_475498 [Mucor mucedo]